MNLRDRFLDMARSHGAPHDVAERWWRNVERRYSEGHRHYHTLTHIGHMLELLPYADETVLAAVWFHDAIYDGASNEERSAALAREALAELGFDENSISRAEELILATTSHLPSSTTQEFLDADLAILGSDPERYREYVAQVRTEYAHVPEPRFRSSRNRILQSFLDRPRIYLTDAFYDRFEQQARENMRREISDEPDRATPRID
jgi:predicted metal-dependent HD superfamily phosphohydrolase